MYLLNDYSHGYVITPLLLEARRSRILSSLKAQKAISLEASCKESKAHHGYIKILSSTLEALGLVTRRGDILLYSDDLDLYEDVQRIPENIINLYFIDPLNYIRTTSTSKWQPFLEDLQSRWPYIQSPILKNFLDGVLIAPLMVSLYQHNKGKVLNNKIISLKGVSRAAKDDFKTLFQVFEWGEVPVEKKDTLVLTDLGIWAYKQALNYALGLSYRPLLKKLDTLLFGDSRVVFGRIKGHEGHVDRTLNVLASGSMHKTYFKAMVDTILTIFNDPEISKQPYYIVDTGCGDGTLLAEIYLTICSSSLRGNNLDKHHLVMVGVDYNTASLKETSKKLKSLNIPHVVIRGDIGDPSSIIKELSNNGIDISKRILHVRSFLDHDRPFKASKDIITLPVVDSHSAYTTQNGEELTEKEVIYSLLEHLKRWAEILDKNADLMVLEVHNMSPRQAFLQRHHSISLHFDPLQALSGQFLVPAKTFVACSTAVGLIPQKIIRFPDDQPFTRITFNHFRRQNYRIRCIESKDSAALIHLAQTTRSWDMGAFQLWLERQISENPTSHFVLEKCDGNSLFQIQAVIYTTTTPSLDQVPTNLLQAEGAQSLEHPIVHVLDIHTLVDKQEEGRRELMKHVLQLSSLSENCQYVSYLTRSLPLQEDMHASSYFAILLNSKDQEIISFEEMLCQVQSIVPACQGYVRLLLTYPIQPLSQEQPILVEPRANKETLQSWIQEGVQYILNQQITLTPDTSLLALGFDSLELTKLVRYLNTKLQFPLALHCIFRHPRVQQLIDFMLINLESTSHTELSNTYASSYQGIPLSLSQEVMWVWFELVGDTSAYNVPRIEHLCGQISVKALEKSIRLVADRHQILRTRYDVENGLPKQWVTSMDTFITPLSIMDLRYNDDKYSVAQMAIEKEINIPIDLVKGPAFRVRLIQLSDEENVLIFTMHHMVTDGSSIPIFWDEIVTAYHSYKENKEPTLRPLPCQYFDWARWQRKQFEQGLMQKQVNFWISKLGGELPILDLPTDYPYPELQTYNGHRISLRLDEEATKKLKQICANSDSTLFMAIVAAWSAFLCRHTKQYEIIIGTPWANREKEDIQNLIGCFVNTLPLRISLAGTPGYLEIIQRVKKEALDAFENASLPFHKIVEALKLPGHSGRLPVYQTMVALEEENGWIRGKPLAGTKRSENKDSLFAIRDTSKFEISLSLREQLSQKGSSLSGELAYNTDLFSSQTAERMKERFLTFLNELIEHPNTYYENLNLLPNFEEKLLLIDLNKTYLDTPFNLTVIDMIGEQVLKTPQSIAITCRGQNLTYKDLWHKVQQYADYLLEKNVKHGDCVGLLFERTPDLIVSLLAIMKLGASYVPMDPNYPQERLKFMIEDANIQAILTHNECNPKQLNLEAPLIFVDEHIPTIHKDKIGSIHEVKPSPNDIVYILYTSGTTGRPKGVKITHRNLLNNIWWMINCQIPREDFFLTLFSTNICFDQAVEEIFPPFCTGGCVMLVDSVLDLSWRKENVTFMVTTPSSMIYVLKNPIPSSVRSLVLGGEALPITFVEEIFATTKIERIYNSYGPTECTDQATVCVLTRDNKRVSLGKPIANTIVYVLDTHKKLLPLGVWGELYIGGEGVGQGYLNQDLLTKEKFIQNPFGKGRLYRTGDIVRWNTWGELEFSCRSDNQIKIHGVRIEKGEIEEVLLTYPGCQAAYVMLTTNIHNQECLVAYVIPDNLDPQKLDEHCRRFLSLHMVPDTIIVLQSFPLNPNGKIDSKALPDPYVQSNYAESDHINHKAFTSEGAKEPLVEGIIDLYKEILQKEDLNEHTSFFAAGGHSLLAVQFLSQLRARFQIRLKMREFFENSTPRTLFTALRQDISQTQDNSLKIYNNYSDLSSIPSGGSSILIIGGGVAGIMTAIECKKRGIAFQIVEKAGDFGGIWLHGCNKYSKLQTTSHFYTVDSNVSHVSQYPYRHDILNYLAKVAELHQLREKTLFNSRVVEVQRDYRGFAVHIENTEDSVQDTHYYDGILICSGKFQHPYIPTFPSYDGQPKIVHASRLDNVNLQDKKVVIIGGGSYAVEALRIAHQQKAQDINLIARRSYWVLPTFADTVLYSGIDKNDLRLCSEYEGLTKELEGWLEEYYQHHGIAHMIPSLENRAFDVHISTSDEFFKIAELPNVHMYVGEVGMLTSEGVILKDKTSISTDIIIAATGYKDPDFSFLKPIAGDHIDVYKGFMLSNDPRIGFVGFLDMVVSSTAVIPLNLELCLNAMRNPLRRPDTARIEGWLKQMPQDIINNVKAHISWLHDEKTYLEKKEIYPLQQKGVFLHQLIDEHILVNPSAPALIEDDRSISYQDLMQKVISLAQYFRLENIQTIVTSLPQSIESIIIFLAAFKAGSCIIPLDTKIAFEGVLPHLENEKIDMFVTTASQLKSIFQELSSFLDKTKDIIVTDDQKPQCSRSKSLSSLILGSENSLVYSFQDVAPLNKAAIFFTSGSTGSPKGVQHSYISLGMTVQGFDSTICGGNTTPHRLILANGVSHLGGFMSAFAVLYRGGTLILKEKFEPQNYLHGLHQYKPSLIILMTSWLQNLLNYLEIQSDALKPVKRIIVGGEPILDALPQKLRQFTSIPLISTFGISECGPLFCNENASYKPGALRQPLAGVQIKVVKENGDLAQQGEIGELWVKSPAMFQGYLGQLPASQENLVECKWFRTKDFVYVSSFADLVYKGRESEYLPSYKIFVHDLENLLAKDPRIKHAIVLYDFLIQSEFLKVIVVPCNMNSLNESDVISILTQKVPGILINVEFQYQHALSQNFTGKIKRRFLQNPEDNKPISVISRPRVLLFPGQGIQHIGMAQEAYSKSPTVQNLFKQAQEIVGYDVYKICQEGPKEILDRTDVTQLAVFLACLAELTVLKEKDPEFLSNCTYMAGLSLGEYTALVASEALVFNDAVQLLHLRGQAMQEASDLSSQGMVSVIDVPRNKLLSLIDTCQNYGKLFLANDLSPDHAVVAGDQKSCAHMIKLVEQAKGISFSLNVAGAFHTSFMAPAAHKLKKILSMVTLNTPTVPILCNIDAQPTRDPNALRVKLIRQIDNPVQFSAILSFFINQGIRLEDVHEIGSDKKLLGILRQHIKKKSA
jgi:malonyl CoA-acyl carrier protein transacylase